jgi:hypothetical protein
VEEYMRKFFAIVLLVVAAFTLDARGKRDTTATATSATPTPAPPPPAAPRPPETERFYQADEQIGFEIIQLVNGVEMPVNVMARSGCKFMAALGIAQTHAQKTLTAQQINSIRQSAQANGTVSDDMYTPRAAAVINMGFSALGSRLSATEVNRVTTLDRVVEVYSSTIIYGETILGNQHFCEGDHDGIIVYNPYPTSAYREIRGYILIRISGYRLLDPLRSVTDRGG